MLKHFAKLLNCVREVLDGMNGKMPHETTIPIETIPPDRRKSLDILLDVYYDVDAVVRRFEMAFPRPDWTLFEDPDDNGEYCGPDCFVVAPYGDVALYFYADAVGWSDEGVPDDIEDVFANADEYGEIIILESPIPIGLDWRSTLARRSDGES